MSLNSPNYQLKSDNLWGEMTSLNNTRRISNITAKIKRNKLNNNISLIRTNHAMNQRIAARFTLLLTNNVDNAELRWIGKNAKFFSYGPVGRIRSKGDYALLKAFRL